jgi:hypothetical protein
MRANDELDPRDPAAPQVEPGLNRRDAFRRLWEDGRREISEGGPGSGLWPRGAESVRATETMATAATVTISADR